MNNIDSISSLDLATVTGGQSVPTTSPTSPITGPQLPSQLGRYAGEVGATAGRWLSDNGSKIRDIISTRNPVPSLPTLK